MCNIPEKSIFINYKNNHTTKETMIHFGINRYLAEKLLNIYEIKKNHIEQIKNCPLELTIEQEETLIGNLLGDGSLSKLTNKSKNSLFEIKQRLDRSEYIKIIYNTLNPFSKKYTEGKSKKPTIGNKIIHKLSNDYCHWCKLRTICHPVFTSLREKWYIIDKGKSKKIIPYDLKLTWRTAAFWACDDGHNHDGRTFRLYTDCFSIVEVDFLLSLIKKYLSIVGKINLRKGKPTIVFCGDNAFNFMENIKNFVPNCYKYKTLNRLSKYKSRKVTK